MAERARVFALFSIVWPERDGDVSRVKQAAAAHLLLHPDKNTSSMVAHAVRAKLGASLKSLGLPPFRQLLQQDACFHITDIALSEAQISLDSSKLSVAAQEKLVRAIEVVFPPVLSAPPEAKVHRAVAQLLLQQQGYRARCSWIAAAVDQLLGSRSKLGISSPFRQLISLEPCFKLTPTPVQHEVYIKLDAKQILQRAYETRPECQAAAAATAAADPAFNNQLLAGSWPSLSAAAITGVHQQQQQQQQQVHQQEVASLTPTASTGSTGWLDVALSMPQPSSPATPTNHKQAIKQQQQKQQAALPKEGHTAMPAVNEQTCCLADMQFDAAVQALQAAALRMMPQRHGTTVCARTPDTASTTSSTAAPGPP